jgi:hypothetical protein
MAAARPAPHAPGSAPASCVSAISCGSVAISACGEAAFSRCQPRGRCRSGLRARPERPAPPGQYASAEARKWRRRPAAARAAISFSSVVLPLPLRPTSATFRPAETATWRGRSAPARDPIGQLFSAAWRRVIARPRIVARQDEACEGRSRRSSVDR